MMLITNNRKYVTEVIVSQCDNNSWEYFVQLYTHQCVLLDVQFYPFDIAKVRVMIKVCFSLSPVSMLCVCVCVCERECVLLTWQFLEQI